MSASAFVLDPSLQAMIHDETVETASGRQTLLDDLRWGNHARAVISNIEAIKNARSRPAAVFGGDLEIREVARGSEFAFQHYVQQEGIEGFNEGDVLDFCLRRHPEMRTHYEPRKTTVFIGSKYGPPTA